MNQKCVIWVIGGTYETNHDRGPDVDMFDENEEHLSPPTYMNGIELLH